MAKKEKLSAVSGTKTVETPMIVDATATELQANFGKFVDIIEAGGTVIVTKNGKRLMRMVPVREMGERKYTPALQAIVDLNINFPKDLDWKTEKEKYLIEKHGGFGVFQGSRRETR